MKLKFSHHGRQFFFLTFALKGRPQVLSRIVAVDKPNGARGGDTATTSTRGGDSVIGARGDDNNAVIGARGDDNNAVIGARGRAPSVVRSYDVALSPFGEAVIALWKRQHAFNPALTASARVVMPDHCHFLLIVNYDIDPHFDILDWLHHFRRAIEADWAAIAADDGRGPAPSPVWEDAFWLDLSFDARQLAAIRRYIRMNPARAIWKAAHPDRFALHTHLKYPVLPPSADWGGVGDLTLLSNPFLFHVRLARRLTLADHEPTITEMVEKAKRGYIPVSGFISPAEVELWQRLVALPNTRMIKVVPYALPPRFDPSVLESQLLSQDRLLILSSFPQSVARGDKIWRENCETMNDFAAQLCTNATHLAPTQVQDNNLTPTRAHVGNSATTGARGDDNNAVIGTRGKAPSVVPPTSTHI